MLPIKMDSILEYGVPKMRELEELAEAFYSKGKYSGKEKREIEVKMDKLKNELCTWIKVF